MTETYLRLFCSGGLITSELFAQDGTLLAAANSEMPGPALREGKIQRNLRAGLEISNGELQSYGRFLASVAFPKEVSECLGQLLQRGPLRLVLDIGQNLLDVPWEMAWLPGDIGSLALHPVVRISRKTALAHDHGRHSGRIHALVAHANPNSPSYPALPSGDREFDSVCRAFATPECGPISLRTLRHATPRLLAEAVRAGPCTIFHFIGHGDLTPTGGELILEGAKESSHESFFADDLALALVEAGAKLVVLSGCMTGGSSASLASQLSDHGVPAVIAMQLPIGDTDAHVFARSLYSALVNGFTLEEAVFEARTAIRACGPGWASPILLTSCPSCVLFAREAPLDRPPRGNLPTPPTSYIGRGRLIAEQVLQVQRDRLVVLLGSGGIGKTRLSIEIARGAEPSFSHGAWLVSLETVTEDSRVFDSIAKVFGMRDSPADPLEERLLSFLSDQHLLLVLDNCEHITPGCCAAAARILAECPRVHMLATSRHVLGTGAESVVTVPPLTYPDYSGEEPPSMSLAGMAENEAVELLVQRGRSANSRFHPDAENLQTLGRICARLDGIPLAIELAASRLRSFAPEQVLRKLIQDLAWLDLENPGAVPRHKTLRAALDWSVRLLNDKEKLLFMRLGLFRGSFSLGCVEQVASIAPLSEAEIPELLAGLVDKSLVTTSMGTYEMRYRLLDTCRTYAREALASTEDLAELRGRHLEYVSKAVSGMWALARSGNQGEWSEKMRAEQDGISESIRWALASGQPAKAAQVAVDAFPYWAMVGAIREGQRVCLEILSSLPDEEEVLRIKLTLLSGAAAFFAGDRSAYAPMKSAYELARERHPHLVKFVAGTFGPCVYEQGEDDLALEIFQGLVEHCRQSGNPEGEGYARLMIANIQMDRGELSEAQSNVREMLAMKEALNDLRGRGLALCTLAHLDNLNGRAEAKTLFGEGLRTLASIEDYATIPDLLALGSRVFLREGNHALTATLLGLADKLREEAGESPERFARKWIAETHTEIKRVLGADYTKWYKDGRTLSIESAIQLFDPNI